MSENRSREEISTEKRERPRSESSDGGETPSDPVHVDGASELTSLAEAYDVVLADFYADWCGPCRMLEPVVEEIAADTGAVVAKVDVDEHQELAAEYGIQGVPTLFLFVEGEPIKRLVGMQDGDTLRSLIAEYR